MKNNQQGFIGLVLLLIVVALIAYLFITNQSISDVNETIEQESSSAIDAATDTVDKANQAGQKAGETAEDINELID